MEDIHRNPVTNNYDVQISKAKWMEILQLPQVTDNPRILDFLEKWYFSPKHTASCKEMGKRCGDASQFFSVQNRILGQIATSHINRFRLIGKNGRQTYWAVAWIEKGKRNGEYIMQLRPELVEAIEALHLFPADIDAVINENLQDLYMNRAKTTSSERTVRTVSRSVQVAQTAYWRANGTCEFDASHKTFPRRVDGLPYLEVHHLIPLKYFAYFEVPIDIPENIVCLCSTCHNNIHYGKHNREMIERLWDLRKDDLKKGGIEISLSKLLEFYRV